ncbi:hypothetical protein PVK06_026525 [Gossypium arboreum]|uniref:Reverse transcriptase n=1 Tax=Gossypium arboreum TaxID=29729 RepID=A0ABR0NXX3_GOSAR|nr:hypothetical protein PVK06_026525 [Gossypium arboreum]
MVNIWASTSGDLLIKFEDLKKRLVDWSGSIKLKRKGLKTNLTRELKELMRANVNDESLAKIIDTKRHKNCIQSLQYEDGRETSDEGKMEEIARGYFQKLFTFSGVKDMSHILSGIDNVILQDVNSKLTTTYLEDEVVTTLKEIGPTKAFGDNGFLTLFFQKYWQIVGRNVIDFCLKVLNEGILERYLGLPNMIGKRKKASFQILKDRNLVQHEGSQIKGKEISDWITRHIGEIDNLKDKKFTRYVVNEEWCPPLGSDVKVNFDAAYNQSLVRSGSGVVVCKSRG